MLQFRNYYATTYDLSNIWVEADPRNGMPVHGADDLGQTQDGRLERLALVLRIVGDKAQQQMRYQLVPRDCTIAVRVNLQYNTILLPTAKSYVAARRYCM